MTVPGVLEVMLFTDALDKYQQLLEKDRILIVSGQVSFDDFSGGLKMTAREVMDIDEAREKYARGLAISLTDRQIDDQLLNRLRQSLEPPPLGDHSSTSLLSEGGCACAAAFWRNVACLSERSFT
ncbi:DNA polymerase III subunit alpha [Salmonella enterica subsp. enterica]|uniref:DNA polymerase III subunit alpha n=1 Tax=Salmonella enterica I TaxID=59201 RepID=A0A447MXK8_SALET|nr:DNA polymerase III subunit alpha [Salmonella enterica subsp. enterica]